MLFKLFNSDVDKNEELNEIDGISLLKIPVLKFIYYCFLESEKISDDFKRYK